MTVYVYKSVTGKTINIDNFIITVEPGLSQKYQNEILDRHINKGEIVRYDDNVLATADNMIPAYLKKNIDDTTSVMGPDGVVVVVHPAL